MITAGGNHNLALEDDGSVVGWGDNGYGQMDVPLGDYFVSIAAGYDYNLALRNEPRVFNIWHFQYIFFMLVLCHQF